MSKLEYYTSLIGYAILITFIYIIIMGVEQKRDTTEKFQETIDSIRGAGYNIHTKNIVSTQPKKVVYSLGKSGTAFSLMVSQTEGHVWCSFLSGTKSHRWHVTYPESVPDTISKLIQESKDWKS